VTVNQPTARTRFASDSDEDLIFYMSLRSEDPSAAEQAWEEFFFRHREYLLGVCSRFRDTLGDLGVEDLAQDTLVRTFQKAHTFRPLGCGDSNRQRARIRAWLGKIANNLFFSTLRRRPSITFADDPHSDVPEPLVLDEPCSEPGESDRLPLLREGLATLTLREREILLASYAGYESGVQCHRMSTDDVKALAERFQTTPVNLRQIRSRALDKLRRYLADHSNQ